MAVVLRSIRYLLREWTVVSTDIGRGSGETGELPEPAEKIADPAFESGDIFRCIVQTLIEKDACQDKIDDQNRRGDQVGRQVQERVRFGPVEWIAFKHQESAEQGARYAADPIYDGEIGEDARLVAPIGDFSETGRHQALIAIHRPDQSLHDNRLPQPGAKPERDKTHGRQDGPQQDHGFPPDMVGQQTPEIVGQELGQRERGRDCAHKHSDLVGTHPGKRRHHVRQIGAEGIQRRLLRQCDHGQHRHLLLRQGRTTGLRAAVGCIMVVEETLLR